MIKYLLIFAPHWMKYMSQTAADWMPRAMCVHGNPIVITLQIIGDSMIGLAYFSIPLTLWYFARKKKEFLAQYRILFLLFGSFIIWCGVTHLFNILMFWYPMYWTDSFLKLVTGGISLFTAYILIKLIPRALQLPTTVEMETAIRERVLAEQKAASLQAQLQVFTGNVENQISDLKTQKTELESELDLDVHRTAS